MDNITSLQCVFCGQYLFKQPRQLECGDRTCGDCFDNFLKSKKTEQTCPVCNTQISLEKSFRDKAVEIELANAEVKCTNPGCSWQGQSKNLRDHLKKCKFAVLSCPNEGCGELVYKPQMEEHLSTCQHTPLLCEWCGKKITEQAKQVHIETECEGVPVQCVNGCGEYIPRKELKYHLQNGCPLQVRDCEYKQLGCEFRGNMQELAKHDAQYSAYHLKLVNRNLQGGNAELRSRTHPTQNGYQSPQDLALNANALDQQIATLRAEIDHIKSEFSLKLQSAVDAVGKVESSMQQLQEGFGEMALMVQTLQATSYSGTFIWKIPEVQRRRDEAKGGKTISLYSAPFYTSRHGYKLCLRLYMDGDGSGKGTHLSFFLTVMRGEYDALLPWPFRQTVTLILLDQDQRRNIIQSFRPEPTSSSFQRPRNEMNIASGCPTFAPVSVLTNSSYVKDDTIFFKCKIDLDGLDAV